MEWMEVQDVIEGRSDNFENVIYMWRNKVNGKLYVGQAKNFRKRTRDHKYGAYNENSKNNYNVPLHRSIRKYGVEKFEICILECNLNSYDEMNEKEAYYIEYFDILANNNKGYNVANGGGNANVFAGKTEEEMEEIKNKISEAMKGKYTGENNPMYGKKRPEISERMSGENNPMYGKHHSEETRRKHSERMGGENHPQCRKIVLLNTGERFDYIKQASEKYNVAWQSISACCRGKYKSAGKLNGEKIIWMYYEDYLESLK